MSNVLSVTEAARNFSDVINRVYYQEQSFTLTRNGTVVAKIEPAAEEKHGLTGAELAAWWPLRPRLTPEEAEAYLKDIEEARAELKMPEGDAWDS